MKKAIIVDIDGTLADVEHRVHHVQKTEKDWRAFNDGIPFDALNLWCDGIIKAMKKEGYEILLLTGRIETRREQSIEWLNKHGVVFDKLFMRPKADPREDYLIKKEIYQAQIATEYEVLFVVEDRLSVVKMWREIGVVCLQCDWGDF